MFYATIDADVNVRCGAGVFESRIAENATIAGFNTRAEAEEFLLSPYKRGGGWDLDSAKIGTGRYGDCWIKTFDEPKIDGSQLVAGLCDFAPFSANDLRIERPGQHPGGRRYWVTPQPDVLVVEYIADID